MPEGISSIKVCKVREPFITKMSVRPKRSIPLVNLIDILLLGDNKKGEKERHHIYELLKWK